MDKDEAERIINKLPDPLRSELLPWFERIYLPPAVESMRPMKETGTDLELAEELAKWLDASAIRWEKEQAALIRRLILRIKNNRILLGISE